MEAEERPTKLRKLSHELTPSDIPSTHLEANNTIHAPTSTRPELPSPGNSSSDASDSSSNILEIKEPSITANKEDLPNNSAVDNLSNHLPIEATTFTAPGISKNQLKKQKRKAEWEAGRENRKAIRRDKAKAKKIRRKEARDEARAKATEENGHDGNHDINNDTASAGTDAANAEGTEPTPTTNTLQPWLPRKTRRFQKQTHTRLPISFVLDCSFDPLMTDKEIISLGSQLTRCYSDNTKAPYNAHFYVSSWGPETELRKRFDGLMRGTYRNWKGIKFLEGDFVEAGRVAHGDMTGIGGGKAGGGGEMAGVFGRYKRVDGVEGSTPSATDENTTPIPISPPPTPSLIYLTSDSPHTLGSLNPYTTYIIGGLVDKNRHKSLCYHTATRLGIPTAKLPLGQYMKMTSREVLTTNHVVEIMLRWLEVGDWGEAFLGVLPKRKGAVLRGRDNEVEEMEDEGKGEREEDRDHDDDGVGGDEDEDGDGDDHEEEEGEEEFIDRDNRNP